MKSYFVALIIILTAIPCLGETRSDTNNWSEKMKMGIYYSIGDGNSDIDFDSHGNIDFDMEFKGYGIVLELPQTSDSPSITPRIKIGYENVDHDYRRTRFDLSRINIDGSIGFELFDDKMVKIKIGPQIRFAYMYGSNKLYDVNALGIGLAPVLMADMILNDTASLGMEAGYRFSYYRDSDITDIEDGIFYNFLVMLAFEMH